MIRPARREDLPAIAALERDEPKGSQWTLHQLETELDTPRALFLVACAGDTVVGHLLAWQILDELELLTIAVHPNHRKQGHGRALLLELLAVENASVVFLELRRSNGPARSLYLSQGFLEIGCRKAYYRDGEDAILMRRSLG